MESLPVRFLISALPISTGIEEDRRNGLETPEAIRQIREDLPGVHVVLGVSNVSFRPVPGCKDHPQLGVPA